MSVCTIAFWNLYYFILTGILAGVAVENLLIITGIMICVCYCWRRRMKSIKLNKDVEQSPQNTYPASLTSGNTHLDNNR